MASIQSVAIAACYRVVRPLALFMLEQGVSYQDFSRAARQAFVDVATEKFGIRNRPTSISRVAAMTGLSRREVSRLRAQQSIPMSGRTNRPTRVLEAWFHDEVYLDVDGMPLPLPLKSDDGSPDFYGLAAIHGGDIPPVALLRELVRSGSVRRLDGGIVEPVTSLHLADVPSTDAVNRFGVVTERLIKTITANLSPYRKVAARFERTISAHINPADLEAYSSFLSESGHEFLMMQDEWLSKRSSSAGPTVRTGAGLFYFEDEAIG